MGISVEISSNKKRILSVFSLVMINVIAVDSLKNLPMGATYGFSLLFYYLIAAIFFLVPTALVAAELATTWPKEGGVYAWVKEAFGAKWGFLVVWMQWLYNIVWYPTILTMVAGTIFYLVAPDLANNKFYMVGMVLSIFWLATIANFFGMRASSLISTVGTLFGTLLPMLFIICLGGMWWYSGKPLAIECSWNTFIPSFDINNMSYLIAILFGLVGLEMSSVHALEVKDPAKDYPKALLFSVIIVFVSLSLSSLAIAFVVPAQEISIVSGLIRAFDIFLRAANAEFLLPYIGVAIVVGGISSVTTWIIGPTKGLAAATKDNLRYKILNVKNERGVPVNILVIQALICSALTMVYLLMPEVQGAYWALSALTAQLALILYVIMFLAAIKLRYSAPDIKRPYKIPGGKCGIWIVAGMGAITSIAGILIGFLPPPELNVGSTFAYQLFLLLGIIVVCLPPFLFHKEN